MFHIKAPLISVVLHVKGKSDYLEQCICSLHKQTYTNFEVLLVVPKGSVLLFSELQKKYPFLKLVQYSGTKSGARNFGASKAKGRYLLHLDEDMVLSPAVLHECASEAEKTGLKALIVPEIVSGAGNFWTKCRSLEKQLYIGDSTVECARFVEKATFERLGGFDESLDLLDEWDLQSNLLEHGITIGRITSHLSINEKLTLMHTLSRKYNRGRYLANFRRKHKTQQFVGPARLGSYIRNLPKLLGSPVTTVGLCVLKLVELSSFGAGTLNPVQVHAGDLIKEKNKAVFDNEASTYEDKFYKATIGARYVDKKEKDIVLSRLKSALKAKNPRILDLGMGPGRWSRIILESFPTSTVLGLDISPEMVKIAGKNLGEFGKRFGAKVGDMENLPFGDNSFDAVVNIRALKYVPNYSKALAEINRVLKPGGILVLEVPNANIIARFLFYSAPLLAKFSKSGFVGYLNRTKLFTKTEITAGIAANSMALTGASKEFAIPATLYSKTDTKPILTFLKFLDSLLPKSIFGRSIFLSAFAEKSNDKMLNRKPLVSVIIVNYNGLKHLKNCFDSLKNQNYTNIEVILVDNGSSDESIKFVKKNFQWVKIIENKKNLGFAKGNNLGVGEARGDYLFFLNNDAWVKNNTITEIIKTFKNIRMLGIVGCKILNTNGTVQDIGNKIDLTGYPVGIDKKIKRKLIYDLFYICGCALMIKKDIFYAVKGFDEKLFLFVEDVDLCWQTRLLGYKLVTNQKAEVTHVGGGTLIGGVKKGKVYTTHLSRIYLRERNTLRVMLKNLGFRTLMSRVTLNIVSGLLESLIFLFLLRPSVSAAYLKAYWWNLVNLGDTIKERKKVQSQRKVDDTEIVRYMKNNFGKIETVQKLGLPKVVS